jgi:dTDP-4-amino-4,6-dideoxygalactose transaminase
MKSRIIKRKYIPFNFPYCGKKEIENIKRLSSLRHYSGNGYFTKKCSGWIIENIKCKEVLLVHSCTAALEMCAILLNIKKGDEIIMPSYTFVSIINALVLERWGCFTNSYFCFINFRLKSAVHITHNHKNKTDGKD